MVTFDQMNKFKAYFINKYPRQFERETMRRLTKRKRTEIIHNLFLKYSHYWICEYGMWSTIRIFKEMHTHRLRMVKELEAQQEALAKKETTRK